MWKEGQKGENTKMQKVMSENFNEVISNQIIVRTQRILDVILKVMESRAKQEKGS